MTTSSVMLNGYDSCLVEHELYRFSSGILNEVVAVRDHNTMKSQAQRKPVWRTRFRCTDNTLEAKFFQAMKGLTSCLEQLGLTPASTARCHALAGAAACDINSLLLIDTYEISKSANRGSTSFQVAPVGTDYFTFHQVLYRC